MRQIHMARDRDAAVPVQQAWLLCIFPPYYFHAPPRLKPTCSTANPSIAASRCSHLWTRRPPGVNC